MELKELERSQAVPVAVVAQFYPEARSAACSPLGNGHIHGTYLVKCADRELVFQRLNSVVFPSPSLIMENISKVQAALSTHPEAQLCFLSTSAGDMLAADEKGQVWRCSEFMAGTTTYDVPPQPEYLEAAAQAFARFGQRLSHLNPDEFHPTIPRFHDTPHRYQTFLKAWSEADPQLCSEPEKAEIDALLREFPEFGLDGLMEDKVPWAVSHNDTKLNNCLFYEGRPEVACVIDLDTCMAGSWLMDLGDLLRTSVCALPEDTTELDAVKIDQQRFAAVIKGYAQVLQGQISPAEKERMVYSGFLMTLELVFRFFTDHLQGDRYFGAKYPGHNLVRTRSQLRLARQFAEQRPALEALVRQAF